MSTCVASGGVRAALILQTQVQYFISVHMLFVFLNTENRRLPACLSQLTPAHFVHET